MTKQLIFISGASGSGKTYQANQLLKEYGTKNCSVLGLDSYLHTREKRTELGVYHGYNLLSYQYGKLQKDLFTLINKGEPIEVNAYQHGGGFADKEIIEPKDILIIEGVISLYDEVFNRYKNLGKSIFIKIPDALLHSIKVTVDVQRGLLKKYSIEDIMETANHYVAGYLEFCKPSMKNASTIIER